MQFVCTPHCPLVYPRLPKLIALLEKLLATQRVIIWETIDG